MNNFLQTIRNSSKEDRENSGGYEKIHNEEKGHPPREIATKYW